MKKLYGLKVKDGRKNCSKCGLSLPISEFYKDKRTRDGLFPSCKKCHNIAVKCWGQSEIGKVKHRMYSKNWREANKERVRRYRKLYKRSSVSKKYMVSYLKEWIKTEAGKSLQGRLRYKRHHGISEVEKFKPAEIFERDNWICHICGRKVKRDVAYSHPFAATIDHLIPISCGGNHTRLNVKTAHRACNCLRHNNKPAQLVMV